MSLAPIPDDKGQKREAETDISSFSCLVDPITTLCLHYWASSPPPPQPTTNASCNVTNIRLFARFDRYFFTPCYYIFNLLISIPLLFGTARLCRENATLGELLTISKFHADIVARRFSKCLSTNGSLGSSALSSVLDCVACVAMQSSNLKEPSKATTFHAWISACIQTHLTVNREQVLGFRQG